ncbi:ubiquitin carboxyl-terminal hydrolase Usp2 isoform X2 [Orussus abietinus]|uniref:ubiquitin carboxyl-terminal hydrolase Usp2 isoform X2 n=1 Tax=Orussus abietinus TaxID=222816 RepID=UPI000C716040|nr:ubiquitin carboxyl-terminal hydrolase Usp2 isoform X2 [Orussus abietinus]
MPYHRGDHAGAVAVSYSSSLMTPLPNRRYSSTITGTTSSGIGGTTGKLTSYRSSGSSILNRPSGYQSSTTISSYRPTYSECRRSFCSPARSVSSLEYSEAGSLGCGSSLRFPASTSTSISVPSRERSESREILGSLTTSAADIIARYSPSGYVPNIRNTSSYASVVHGSSSSSASIFGGNSADARPTREWELTIAERTSSSSPNPSSSSSGAVGRSSKLNWTSSVGTLLPGHIHLDHAAATPALSNELGGTDVDDGNDDDDDGNDEDKDGYENEDDNDDEDGGLPDASVSPVASVGSVALFAGQSRSSLKGNEGGDVSQPTVVKRAILFGLGSGLAEKAQVASGRPPGNQNDDPSAPSTSKPRNDHLNPGATGLPGIDAADDVSSSSSSSSAQHRNAYRNIAEQIEGSPPSRQPYNRLQVHRDERCGLNGLRNIGNTCFMNSVIQCLSNTKPLLEYLLNDQYPADINMTTSSMKGALIKAFSQVIHELWEIGGDHVVNTTALKSQIQRFAPRFMGYSQQDAQEFLRYLLEGLHEDVNRVTIKPQPIHTDIPDHYTDSQKATESWKRYLRSEDSTIVDVFVGQLRSSLHCTSCGHVSVTLDPFWDLSLPIPSRSGTVKLNQCLEHFTKEEVLDGDEKPTCSKCQMRRKCTKSFSIQKFPKILVIHKCRFRFNQICYFFVNL